MKVIGWRRDVIETTRGGVVGMPSDDWRHFAPGAFVEIQLETGEWVPWRGSRIPSQVIENEVGEWVDISTQIDPYPPAVGP